MNNKESKDEFCVTGDLAVALMPYCRREKCTPSEALSRALREYIPDRYFKDAARSLNKLRSI